MNPHVASRAGLATLEWTTVGSARYLTVALNRNAATTDVQYLVEVSSDLATWFTGPVHTTVLTNTPALLRVRDNTPSDTAPQRFIRVKVTP